LRDLLRRAREHADGAPAALAASAKAAEIDVQLSRDDVLVPMHDDTLERTADGTGRSRERSLAELRRLDARSRFAPTCRRKPVPTLAKCGPGAAVGSGRWSSRRERRTTPSPP
jgi:hypothetical protein